ncbi:MAG TPA: hypothetical protein IAA62_02230 [Candidatus Caccopulliclostridium gallistercoris]|uniref:Uncharacterized protein n=1 Tax=Candidatus Caccopulliclostridium gallistercoris TaxID=2840719 RepID=A0A9D1NEX5_9FIRM|nr:hypothetical protein [Candidatus Caccopulliclostridium gallistercoris]
MQEKISQIPLEKDFLKYFLTDGEKKAYEARLAQVPSKTLAMAPLRCYPERRALATIREWISLSPELARL